MKIKIQLGKIIDKIRKNIDNGTYCMDYEVLAELEDVFDQLRK